MPELEKSLSNQIPPASAESIKWDPILYMRPPPQSNTLEESDGWFTVPDHTTTWFRASQDTVIKVGDMDYRQELLGLNFNSYMAAGPMHPSPISGVGDYDSGYMPSMNPNIAGGPNHTSATMQASPILSIDDNGGPSSFDQAEPTSQPTPNTLSGSSIAWTKQEEKCLMSLKLQGLSYSDIQEEMRKEFGWARNKNVLGKRFAFLKKRSKPQIKTRIVREVSRKITSDIIKAVGKELEKVTSSDSNNVAAELEDLMHLKFPEFLENLVADVSVSLSQAVDDDDHDLSA
ncbi:hypothetical protein FAVG1_07590 [Fusarium avenaceum]|nr:hypothetical protein FAVG1_07590 [Fusarium avenaceum]